MLPLERVAQWADRLDIPIRVLGRLIDHADAFAQLLTGIGGVAIARALTRVPRVGPLIAPVAVPALREVVELGLPRLNEIHAEAISGRDYLTATLTQFRLDLDQGVSDGLLVKSRW